MLISFPFPRALVWRRIAPDWSNVQIKIVILNQTLTFGCLCTESIVFDLSVVVFSTRQAKPVMSSLSIVVQMDRSRGVAQHCQPQCSSAESDKRHRKSVEFEDTWLIQWSQPCHRVSKFWWMESLTEVPIWQPKPFCHCLVDLQEGLTPSLEINGFTSSLILNQNQLNKCLWSTWTLRSACLLCIQRTIFE